MLFYGPFRNAFANFSGKPDLFYPEFYKAVNNTSCNSPFSLSKRAHLIFGYDLANYILAHLSESIIVDGAMVFPEKKSTLSEREKSIITYLGGYVICYPIS